MGPEFQPCGNIFYSAAIGPKAFTCDFGTSYHHIGHDQLEKKFVEDLKRFVPTSFLNAANNRRVDNFVSGLKLKIRLQLRALKDKSSDPTNAISNVLSRIKYFIVLIAYKIKLRGFKIALNFRS